MLLTKYRDNDVVTVDAVTSIVSCVSDLRAYIESLSNVLKLSVHVIGSFATGLALLGSSPLDILVVLDGGHLTSSLDNDQLALALGAALGDWKDLKTVSQVAHQTGMLLCETREGQIRLNMHASDTSRIPVSYMYHSILFSSYARLNSRVPVFVGLVKRWARTCGFSSRIACESCPLTGFHWTIISLSFLIDSGIIPNLHIPCVKTASLDRIQFGPNSDTDSFAVITDEVVGHKLNKGFLKSKNSTPNEYLAKFFGWLATADLLACSIKLQSAGSTGTSPTTTRGWLNIVDPCVPGDRNTIHPSISQKAIVRCAMTISREASKAAKILDETKLAEYIYTKKTENDPNSRKIDVAVP